MSVYVGPEVSCQKYARVVALGALSLVFELSGEGHCESFTGCCKIINISQQLQSSFDPSPCAGDLSIVHTLVLLDVTLVPL